MLMDLIH